MKYLAINLAKHIQSLYDENYKTLMKELEEDRSVIQFQYRHDVWRPLCNGFTLVQIICNPGGKCTFCVKANRKHIWAQIKRMITALYALCPLPSPQGSRSVCLGTFSLAAFGLGGKNNQHHPQKPQQRMRAVEMDNLKRRDILQGLGAPSFTVGEAAWGDRS